MACTPEYTAQVRRCRRWSTGYAKQRRTSSACGTTSAPRRHFAARGCTYKSSHLLSATVAFIASFRNVMILINRCTETRLRTLPSQACLCNVHSSVIYFHLRMVLNGASFDAPSPELALFLRYATTLEGAPHASVTCWQCSACRTVWSAGARTTSAPTMTVGLG